jgi:hypothetical protein
MKHKWSMRMINMSELLKWNPIFAVNPMFANKLPSNAFGESGEQMAAATGKVQNDIIDALQTSSNGWCARQQRTNEACLEFSRSAVQAKNLVDLSKAWMQWSQTVMGQLQGATLDNLKIVGSVGQRAANGYTSDQMPGHMSDLHETGTAPPAATPTSKRPNGKDTGVPTSEWQG